MEVKCSRCGTINDSNQKICKGCMGTLENENLIGNVEDVQVNDTLEKKEFIKPLIKFIILYIINVVLIGWLGKIAIGLISLFLLKFSITSNNILSIISFILTIIEEFIIVYAVTHSNLKKYNIDRKKFNVGIIVFYIIMCVPLNIQNISLLAVIGSLVTHILSFIFVNYFLFSDKLEDIDQYNSRQNNNDINKSNYLLVFLGIGIVVLLTIFIFKIVTDDSNNKKVYYEGDNNEAEEEIIEQEETENNEVLTLTCSSTPQRLNNFVSSYIYKISFVNNIFDSYNFTTITKYDDINSYQREKEKLLEYESVSFDDQTLTIVDSVDSSEGSTGIEDVLQGLNVEQTKNEFATYGTSCY